MNEKSHTSLISEKNTDQVSQKDAATTTISDGGQTSTGSTYELFSWLLSYSKKFVSRLANDLFKSILAYFYSGQVLPDHIVEILRVQKTLNAERESRTITYSRECCEETSLPLRKFFNAFTSYILCSEDDIGLQCSSAKAFEYSSVDREPIFVIVDTSCISEPSSKEILIDNKTNPNKGTILKKHLNKNVLPIDIPSTSKDLRNEILQPQLKESDSIDELLMLDINLQSENELILDDDENDNESIVVSYLRNKDALLNREGTLLTTKKKSSLLENVPKMETILEGEHFSSFPLNIPKTESKEDMSELSETSLDVHIPSYPGTPRSFRFGSWVSLLSYEERHPELKKAVDFLHQDNEFLVAAEIGDDKLLEVIISKGTHIQQLDQLGRNALHLAVVAGNIRCIVLLLGAGINPNVKDNVGMTPLSLSLMRRPSLKVANLLFDYGSVILPRLNPMDTGLFLQYVMMCIPTAEEKKILKLLVEKGGKVNDPEAPGGRQALHYAAMSNNCELILTLMDLGANLYEINHRNETPREFAIKFQCWEASRLLEELEECDVD